MIAGQNGLPWWYFQEHGGPLEGTVLESVDPGGRIAAAIPAEAVIGCVIYCSTEIVEPGVIRHIEGTRYAIGEPDGERSPRCREISRAFVAGGLKCPVETSIRDQVWLKLIGNAAFNPVSAITGATLGELGTVPETVELLRAILEECAAVAARLGIELPVSIDRRLEAGLEVGDHKTSMLQDLEAGKPLELDCLTGATIELAGRLGLEVPHTASVHACAKLLERLRAAALTPAGATRANAELPGCGSAPPTRGATPSPRSSRPTVGAGMRLESDRGECPQRLRRLPDALTRPGARDPGCLRA